MRTHTALFPGILTAVAVVALSGCGSLNPVSPSISGTPLESPAPPAPQGVFTVTGVVTELVDGEPVALEGALVEDSQRHFGVRTAADGSYTIQDVESYQGDIYLFFSKEGYHSISRTFAPSANELRVDVLLIRE
jgi:hypothetical protein